MLNYCLNQVLTVISTLIILLSCTKFSNCSMIKSIDNTLPNSNNNNNNRNILNCGYKSCHKIKENMLNVHLIPHTHDDAGWVATFDEYYKGARVDSRFISVKKIIDSVIHELLQDSNRRFIYVESSFFFKWWDEQSDQTRGKVKQLVNDGRLEFIGGAWTMNDEATTQYQSIIDQFTWGLRKLNDTFGECGRPKIGWQIDPFGHSREMASLFGQMYYDGLLIGRIDHQDKANRLLTKTTEFMWHGSNNLGNQADIFTSMLYNEYGPPHGFCFDILCPGPDSLIEGISETKLKLKIDGFIEYIKKQSKSYRTNNIVWTAGGDFNYMNAEIYYKNIDKLIKEVNARQTDGSEINLIYSTPSCYMKAVQDANLNWSSKYDDFFPYASNANRIWSGYYTSRPTLKLFDRIGNNFLQICKQLSVTSPITQPFYESNLIRLREAVGLLQHHDAVAGTEKQRVANDYMYILNDAIDLCNQNTKDALQQLTHSNFAFDTCVNLNISKCGISEKNDAFIITLYNPLSKISYQNVRVPVDDDQYLVRDGNFNSIPIQIIPIPTTILQLRNSSSNYELVFRAEEIPPIGFKSYFVTRTGLRRKDIKSEDNGIKKHSREIGISIGNDEIRLNFDLNDKLSTISSNGRLNEKLRQDFYYYGSTKSGAYVFNPDKYENIIGIDDATAEVRVYRGQLVEEVHQTINEWISQVIRVYKDENYVEFDWLIGPVPQLSQYKGIDFVTRYETDIQNNNIFYTDSNGREMIKRQLDHRNTWNYSVEHSIAGNYYPVTSKITIDDYHSRLSILPDRSQGGSSIENGTIELMIHRRLRRDDGLGVGEVLNEMESGKGIIVRGKHYLILSSDKSEYTVDEKKLKSKISNPNWMYLSDASHLTYEDWRENYTNLFSGLAVELPENINLLTLEPWKDQSILVRLEHIFELDEHPTLSTSVVVNLRKLFGKLNITSIRETTLAANQWLEDTNRLQFGIDSSDSSINDENLLENCDSISKNGDITLCPMQIRTFVIYYK